MVNKLRITYVRSSIGCPRVQKDTVKGLGLTKLNQSTELDDTPSVRGMVNKIPHLLRVEAIEGKGQE